MIEVKNCKRCGKIFNHIGGPQICPDCKLKEEEEFGRIKEYLEDNPKAALAKVAEDLELSISTIERYIKNGRLETLKMDNIFIKCERCGEPIQSGRLCPECAGQLSNGFKQTAGEMRKKGKYSNENNNVKRKGGFRFINKDE